jgi:hypothetical protein
MTLRPQTWMLLGFGGIVAYLMVTGAKKAVAGTTQAPALGPSPYVPSMSTSPASTGAASVQSGAAQAATEGGSMSDSGSSSDWLSAPILGSMS